VRTFKEKRKVLTARQIKSAATLGWKRKKEREGFEACGSLPSRGTKKRGGGGAAVRSPPKRERTAADPLNLSASVRQGGQGREKKRREERRKGPWPHSHNLLERDPQRSVLNHRNAVPRGKGGGERGGSGLLSLGICEKEGREKSSPADEIKSVQLLLLEGERGGKKGEGGKGPAF